MKQFSKNYQPSYENRSRGQRLRHLKYKVLEKALKLNCKKDNGKTYNKFIERIASMLFSEDDRIVLDTFNSLAPKSIDLGDAVEQVKIVIGGPDHPDEDGI
jgi:hypothetical protein